MCCNRPSQGDILIILATMNGLSSAELGHIKPARYRFAQPLAEIQRRTNVADLAYDRVVCAVTGGKEKIVQSGQNICVP